MNTKLLISSTLLLVLTACGSSSDDSTTQPQETIPVSAIAEVPVIIETPEVIEVPEVEEVIEASNPVTAEETISTGMFLDSAVTGLNYKTASQSGTTNALGEFNFQTNETITFSIGDIELPSTTAALYLTPLELYQTKDINQIEVVNLIRLLQSLDMDGDASNGIEIDDSVHQLAANLDIDFSSNDFEQQVATLVSQSGAANQTLIAANIAIAHFQLTLDKIADDELKSCTTNHALVGQSGFFNTIAHNVSGKATVIDDCTIEISQFSYDGGGPVVYLYAAIDHQYNSSDAFEIGPRLSGRQFNNDTFTITLPAGKSLDNLNGLSVWCIDFKANFGQVEFTP